MDNAAHREHRFEEADSMLKTGVKRAEARFVTLNKLSIEPDDIGHYSINLFFLVCDEAQQVTTRAARSPTTH